MRGLAIVLGVVAAIYAADKLIFDGRLTNVLTEMTIKARHHIIP